MIGEHLNRDLYVTVDEADDEGLRRLERLGFAVSRRESDYLIPTDPEVTGLQGVELPAGFSTISASDADEDRLRVLDDALRQDVPGADGWRSTPAEFHEQTFDAEFDPATYLVAVEQGDGGYAGLVRVWNKPEHPRLGLIAVLAPHRGRGLARGLVARAFAVLHERGKAEVTAEADDPNVASVALLTAIGARRTGGSVELLRHHHPFGVVDNRVETGSDR